MAISKLLLSVPGNLLLVARLTWKEKIIVI